MTDSDDSNDRSSASEFDGETDSEVILVIETLRRAAQRLALAKVRDEVLAEFVDSRRKLLIARPATMLVKGRAWRVGAFLLDAHGDIYTLGRATRAVEPTRPNFQSASAEERRVFRDAAYRAGLSSDDTVNFDWAPLVVDRASLSSASSPIFLRDGAARVRWSLQIGDASAPTLESYLDERIELLRYPAGEY